MKTSLTVTVDGDIKQKAMQIIEGDMNSTISYEINQLLKKIVRKVRKRK